MSYRQQILDWYLRDRWTLLQTFTSGRIVDELYHIEHTDDGQVVLKVATTAAQLEDIEQNHLAGAYLIAMGLGWFHPEVVRYHPEDSRGFIVFEYAGKSFTEIVRVSTRKRHRYDTFLDTLLRVYKKSAKSTPEFADQQLVFVIQKCIALIEAHFSDMTQANGLLGQLGEIELWVKRTTFSITTFSQMDFTPEDTYWGLDRKWRYSDLSVPIRGLPMIDLATFSSHCVRLGLPASYWAVGRFQKVAVGEAAKICGLDKKTANNVFLLGQILQLLITASSLRATEPGRANEMLTQVTDLIQQVIVSP